MAYITLADFKAYKFAGGATVPTTDDTLISSLITRAQSLFELRAGRIFEAATVTKTFDTPTGRCLRLGNEDLLTITTLTNGDGTTITNTEYKLYPLNTTPKNEIKLLASSAVMWTSTTNGDIDGAISVAGTWGYSATAPDAVKHAVARLTHWIYTQKDTMAEGDRAMFVDGAVLMPVKLPGDVDAVARSYWRKT